VQTELPRDPVGSGRQGLVWQLLADVIAGFHRQPVRVLDCGGGSGSFAVPLARLGATVTVVDISVDALATLTRRAEESGVATSVLPVQGDLEALGGAIGAQRFDLVLAHGVLASVDHVASTFAAITDAVRPGGRLSVLVANPVASVLARALGGDVLAALGELRALDADFGHPGPATVQALCRATGMVVEKVHGIGVFTELVPGRALDTPGMRAALAQLEAESATRSPFAEIAGKVLVLARRPVSQ
jgi:S-adenosylmethionine-dependent methyltransferase